MDQSQNARNAQNAQNVNGDGVEEMEVVPPHLDPLNQEEIIATLQHQIAQMRLELDRGRNQHLLGVQDNAPNVSCTRYTDPGMPKNKRTTANHAHGSKISGKQSGTVALF